jgi:hypothetical protein
MTLGLWTTCNKSVELNNVPCSKLLVNEPLTTCQHAEDKQCEHILLTRCGNIIATRLLQVCYNWCVYNNTIAFYTFDYDMSLLKLYSMHELNLTGHLIHARIMFKVIYSNIGPCIHLFYPACMPFRLFLLVRLVRVGLMFTQSGQY